MLYITCGILLAIGLIVYSIVLEDSIKNTWQEVYNEMEEDE